MIAGLFGIVGIVACLFVADAWQKDQGGRVALYLSAVLVCFGITIVGAGKQPDFLTQECDRYSVYASSC